VSDLNARLDKIKYIIEKDSFYTQEGCGGELNFHIFDYEPSEELVVRSFVRNLVKNYSYENSKIKPIVFDLFEMILEILRNEEVLEYAIQLEEEEGTEELFNATSELLKPDNFRDLIKSKLLDEKNYDFAYTGLIRCAHCGCRLTAEFKKGKYIYYHCTGNKGGECKRDYINELMVDKAFAEIIRLIVIPQNIRERILKELKLVHEKKNGYSKEVKNNIIKQITRLENRIEEAFTLKLDNAITHDFCKLLLEKVTIFLKSQKAKANFIFEHRRNTHYDELETYMRKVIDCEQYVLSLKALTKSQSKCLQLADIIASSTYQAFEPNQYDGDVEPLYYMKLSDNIFMHNGKCLGYGLKLPTFKKQSQHS